MAMVFWMLLLSLKYFLLNHQLDLLLDWDVVVPPAPVVSVHGVHGLLVYGCTHSSSGVPRSAKPHLVGVTAELFE